MRRSFLKAMLVCAWSGSTVSLSLLARNAYAEPAASSFDVLNRPALKTAKAASGAILAVTRADKRLIAAGEHGIVLWSDDQGASWRQAEVPVSVSLTALQFINHQRGWAIGHLGVVLTTNDGGEHWVRQFDGVQAARVALEVAQKDGAASDASRQLAAAQALSDDGPDKPFFDLYFENERIGYIVGAYNMAFRTDDGGQSWHSWMNHIDNPKGFHLYAIKAVGDAMYIAGEQGLLLKSIDGGQRFAPVTSPSKGTYFGIVAGRDRELLVYGLRGRAFWSGDGGTNWSEVDTGTRSSLSAGICLDNGNMLLASQAGELLISHDRGRTFKLIPRSEALPVTGLAQSAAGRLVASSLRGLHAFDPALATS